MQITRFINHILQCIFSPLSRDSSAQNSQISPKSQDSQISSEQISHMSMNSQISASMISDNYDILTEILLCLPAKSICCFRSVSKVWFKLTNDPHFLHLHMIRRNNAVSGLFFRHKVTDNPVYDYFDFGENNIVSTTSQPLDFVQDPAGISIQQSCNGLFLCGSHRFLEGLEYNYYVYNPTTNKFIHIPSLLENFGSQILSIYRVNLAFDPRVSRHYKIICIFFSDLVSRLFKFTVYSSETGVWGNPSSSFPASFGLHGGVYWNGALHWYDWYAQGMYFNLEQERLSQFPLLPLRENQVVFRFMGESNDHLHLIEMYTPQALEFDVYEMQSNYSCWIPKYHVDLKGVMDAFPWVIFLPERDPSDIHYYHFHILDVIRGKGDDDSFLLLNIPSKVVRYNLSDGSFTTLCDFAPVFS